MQPPRNRNDDFIFSHAGNALLFSREPPAARRNCAGENYSQLSGPTLCSSPKMPLTGRGHHDRIGKV